MENAITKPKQKKLNDLARKIIKENQLVSIATASKECEPWISPVVYAYDKKWNMYFVSIPSSVHCQNIRLNGKCACAIFDSRHAWGTGAGLQIEAKIEELSFKNTLKAGKCYISRVYPYPNYNPKVVADFVQNFIANKKIYKFYKITPRVVWMNDPNSEVDVRVQVDLNG